MKQFLFRNKSLLTCKAGVLIFVLIQSQLIFAQDITLLVKGLTSENAIEKFPYEVYLKSVDVANITAIQNDLRKLDSLKLPGKDILIEALVNRGSERVANRNKDFNFDSVLLNLRTAEKYITLSELGTENRLLYLFIGKSLIDRTNKLFEDYTAANEEYLYVDSCRILLSRFKENNITPILPVSSGTEKVIYNIAHTKWGYLAERFMIAPKWVIALLALMGIWGVYSSFYTIRGLAFKKESKK
jgi:hypothetical protein